MWEGFDHVISLWRKIMLNLITAFVLGVLFGQLGVGLICLVVAMFKKYEGKPGINYLESGKKYDMASWFEPMDGVEFYGYDQNLKIDKPPKHTRYD